MTYAQYGLVQASDYNTLVGNTGPTTAPNQINTIWGIGTGARGYGQSPLSQISPNGVVYASQWSTLISTVNSILQHQGSSGTGITLPTFGNTISYLGTLQSAITTGYNNALNFSGHGGSFVPGGTITTNFSASISNAGSNPPNSQTNQTSITRSFGLTATFSSADQARYFFNAGGQLNFVVTGVTNNDNTQRSADAITTMLTNFGGVSAFRANTNGGRTGTGGTVTTNNTAVGYYNLSTSVQNTQYIASANVTYNADFTRFYVSSNGTNLAGHNDAGSAVIFQLNYASTHAGSFNDTLNVTVGHRVDVIYPETTNLANTWGAVVIS